jgi:A/G-specific adenine glycosylase
VPSTSWREGLLKWYGANRRDLPWRRTCDPYAIWISEVMLQQTQVATVIPYFERWMSRFPIVESLAEADEQDVLSLWQGLGYYRRAKLLRKGACWIVANGWPSDVAAWREVPGVGEYTAAAIGSIAQNLPAAVVDGNVERVFARFTASDLVGTGLLRAARVWAADVLVLEHHGDWNQALMELGATVCTPRDPKCSQCPIEERCVARQTWTVDRFPVAEAKPAIVCETHTVWVPLFEGRFGVRQIPEGQWWAGMWEFPRSVKPNGEEALGSRVGEGWPENLGKPG